MMSLSSLISGQVGSREPIPHLDVEVAGAGAFVDSPAIIFDCNHWGCAQDLDGQQEGSSHIFSGSLALYSRFRELSIGVLFLPCKHIPGFILVSTT